MMVEEEFRTHRQHSGELGSIATTHRLEEGLVDLIKERGRVSATATKTAITTIYYIAKDINVRVRLVKAGAVGRLLEIAAEEASNKCINSERSVAALYRLCNCEEGRSAANENALTVPVIVEKMSCRGSKVAAEFAVCILWTICRHSSDGSAMLEALQMGAFQKLLVLLQLGCSEKTRKKATQLLKLFSHYRQDWECINSLDFKDVQRSF